MVAAAFDGGIQTDGLTGCGGARFEHLSVERDGHLHVAGKRLLGIGTCGYGETDACFQSTVSSRFEGEVLDVVRSVGMGVEYRKAGHLFHIVEVPCGSRSFRIVEVHIQQLCEGVVVPFVHAEVVGIACPEVSSGTEVDGSPLVFIGGPVLGLCHECERSVFGNAVEFAVGGNTPKLSLGIGSKVAQTLFEGPYLMEFTALGVHLAEVTAVAVAEGVFADGVELFAAIVVGKVYGDILVVLFHGDTACRCPRLRVDLVECHLVAAVGTGHIVADVAALAVSTAGIGDGLAVAVNLRDGHKGMRTVGIEGVEAVFRVAAVP